MGTVFTVLAVIAFAAAIFGLFAPHLALAWLPFIRHTPLKAVSLYLALALFLMLVGQNVTMDEEEDAASQAIDGSSAMENNATAAGGVAGSNATAASPEAQAGQNIQGNATGQTSKDASGAREGQAGQVAQPGVNGMQPAASLNKNGTQPLAPENSAKEKSTMEEAQEAVTRAANATVEFGRDAADKVGETGTKLYEGAKEIGKELLGQ